MAPTKQSPPEPVPLVEKMSAQQKIAELESRIAALERWVWESQSSMERAHDVSRTTEDSLFKRIFG